MNQFMKYLILALVLTGTFSSCDLRKKKRLNERITLKRTDLLPYGTYVAYENLKYIFPLASININKKSPSEYGSMIYQISYDLLDDSEYQERSSLYIIIAPYFDPSKTEYDMLMRFVSEGNHVFISSFEFGQIIEDSLNLDFRSVYPKLKYTKDSAYIYEDDSLWVKINHPFTTDSFSFTYPGTAQHHNINKVDSVYTSVLGKDKDGKPNFVRQTYTSGGSIMVHTDPMALTNFFLLHKNNNAYYNNVFSYLPSNVKDIEWDEYFRYGKKDFSALQVIMSNRGLEAAFWLILLLFLLIYLFESKRRQRIIPVVPPLKNSSLDFVKTIGRLYYQYHDNQNLGQKMTAHLLDHIRTKYNIATTVLDEHFVNQLAYKSGYDRQKLHNMIYRAKMMNDFGEVTDEDLAEFHKQTEEFYKSH